MTLKLNDSQVRKIARVMHTASDSGETLKSKSERENPSLYLEKLPVDFKKFFLLFYLG